MQLSTDPLSHRFSFKGVTHCVRLLGSAQKVKWVCFSGQSKLAMLSYLIKNWYFINFYISLTLKAQRSVWGHFTICIEWGPVLNSVQSCATCVHTVFHPIHCWLLTTFGALREHLEGHEVIVSSDLYKAGLDVYSALLGWRHGAEL